MSASRTGSAAFLALLAVTAIWGSTFFLIKDVVSRIDVADLLALRFALAAAVLAVVAARQLRMPSATLRRGVLLGLLYGVAQILQTVGLAHTAASVSGFVTGLYVVATPLLAALVLRAPVPRLTWLAVGLATVGLGVLSLHGFAMGYGEGVTLVAALIYAVQILALSRWSDRGSALGLAGVQTAVVAVVCAVAALADGTLVLPRTAPDWLAVLYLAVVAGALTMVLQTWAQARIDASRAAVLMAMEPVWAAGFAVALGGERVTARMLLGGAAIVAAMYLVEVAPRARPSVRPLVRTRVASRRADR